MRVEKYYFMLFFLLRLFYFTFSLKMEAKSKGLKEQQQHHKKLLAAMLSQDSFDSVHSPTPSVVEEEIEDEDDAMELLGNLTARYDLHTKSQVTNLCNICCVIEQSEWFSEADAVH